MPWFLAVLLLLCSLDAWADTKLPPPVLLWGFQRGCTPLTNATRDVQEHLELTLTKPVDVLLPDRRLLSCQGPGCVTLVQQGCPNAKGRIVGGIVDQNSAHTLTRMRLWFYDPQTGQTAYHDNYCQNCDMTKALKANAVEIAQNPTFMSPPGSTPLYCQAEPAYPQPAPRSGKIYWVVYGKDHQKSAITAAVRKLVQPLGPDVPFEHEGKEYTSAVLKKVLAKEPGAQVFGIEIQANGKLEIFLYDGPTELIEIQKVECDGCDKDDLIEKVRQTSLHVLSHCFGDNCARVGRSRAPAEACRPFEMPRCGDPGETPILLTSPSADTNKPGSSPPSAPEISPRLAKLTKGGLWGAFSVTAGISVALIIANATSAGTVESGDVRASNALALPAGITAGVAGLLLGIAIPATILVDRASMPASHAITETGSASSSPGALGLQCPK